tara:strand:- start:16386 stop:19202 length:2817 start_codon:yes stop_codon:yes gene_type:complete
MAKKKRSTKKSVETIVHDEAKRPNIPTAEFQSVMSKDDQTPIQVAYERRNRDLDPQLVWRGKDEQDWSDLVVNAPPLFIQEKVHPKVLVDDLLRRTHKQEQAIEEDAAPMLFADHYADFNGLPDDDARTEFYQHDTNWTNRMILGDSLQVMASLAEREGLRGKVQCIYIDPPYGIKFNSNFQWSTTCRDVKDGRADHITRDPEQVKAFRDTWRDGIHSYLTYLRDRLTVARDLLTDSGSIFVQIGDENVHRVRMLLDEVFGDGQFVEQISYRTKNMTLGGRYLEGVCDTILWYSKNTESLKFRRLYKKTNVENDSHWNQILSPDGSSRKLVASEIRNHASLPDDALIYQLAALYPTGAFATGVYPFDFQGKTFNPPSGRSWKSPIHGMQRLKYANRIEPYSGGKTIRYRLRLDDYPVSPIHNIWLDTAPPSGKTYVVQTGRRAVERCILMASDPGDLVLDPTCGSGTAAFVAEQWGRRWITVDTSRVALALARARIMGARYPYYVLADSKEGQVKEASVSRSTPSTNATNGNIRHGFVHERVPHITLKSIANNAEIDVIWDKFQETLEQLRDQLNKSVKQKWEEWEIPREAEDKWPDAAKKLHAQWWAQRIARQKEIDASIAAKADFEYLYDKPYEDKKKVRVAGPFTVESLSPHRTLGVDEDDELIDPAKQPSRTDSEVDFGQMILENLKTSGVQQAHKEGRIKFSSLTPWPGTYICAEGRYMEGDDETGTEKRAGLFIGPEFGTVSRQDLVTAAREAGDADFDVLIACAFNYEAHASEFNKLGRIPVLKARMNADLHMADDLKNTGKGNLFVIFGEPDIDILEAEDGKIQVKINGVDVFHPQTGEVHADSTDGIACWFIDTEYNEESFFVRQAYFLGANDPYKSLKTTLKTEINADAWATLNSDLSRPFSKPENGRIAVKVINHLGDEVMKVFRVD